MDTKPGYATTEFWMTLLTHAITVVVFVYTVVLHRSFTSLEATNALIPVAAVFASMIGQAVYTHGRSKLKAAVLGAKALAAQAPVINVNGGSNNVLQQLADGLAAAAKQVPQSPSTSVSAAVAPPTG